MWKLPPQTGSLNFNQPYIKYKLASSALVRTRAHFACWRHIPNPLRMTSSMPSYALTSCVLIHSGSAGNKKSGQSPIFILMIALILISAAVVSFSDLPLHPSSAEQHRKIPHSASRSDNPSFLFLFFCTHCKLPFFQKAVL